MRHISFALTTDQIRAHTKFVTRRLGWYDRRTAQPIVKPGDLLQAIVKGQGLKKNEHVEKLGVIRVVESRLEPLNIMLLNPQYGALEVRLEGFPEMSPGEFVGMFCRHNGCAPGRVITRIAFTYI